MSTRSTAAWRFGCGAVIGAFVGLLFAPRLQRWARIVGVDPYGLTPAIVIIVCSGIVGGVIWATGRLGR